MLNGRSKVDGLMAAEESDPAPPQMVYQKAVKPSLTALVECVVGLIQESGVPRGVAQEESTKAQPLLLPL